MCGRLPLDRRPDAAMSCHLRVAAHSSGTSSAGSPGRSRDLGAAAAGSASRCATRT